MFNRNVQTFAFCEWWIALNLMNFFMESSDWKDCSNGMFSVFGFAKYDAIRDLKVECAEKEELSWAIIGEFKNCDLRLLFELKNSLLG